MLRPKTICVAALLLAIGCSGVVAGELVPRSGNALAPAGDVCDDAGAPAARGEAPSPAAMNESDAPAPAAPSHGSPRTSARPVAHIGADDVFAAAARQPAPASGDEKVGAAASVPAHKSHALRWQSLLPGVMK